MPRIVHLGVGNFFRAHQAWYTQACPGWTITGVSFRSNSIRNGLAAQHFEYTLVIKGATCTQTERITCLTGMLVAPEDPGAVTDLIADEGVSVISVTVTEKGYHLDPAGALDLAAPAIRDDLGGSAATMIGALARGLAKRKAPITVLSCDNLPGNGVKLHDAVFRFAAAAGLTISAKVAFPSCMVDRITPATTDELRASTGDPMAVATEAFSEWVIEDHFAAARPNWPGVQWVDDVAPHEMRKLRMLNGAHSYLAYAGTLRGHTFVHEAVADPILRKGSADLMSEAAETLPADMRVQASEYADALLSRFANPNIDHRLRQIAMDGSQKMPIRVVRTLADRAGANSPALHAAIEAWVAFVRAEAAAGRALDDPLADRLTAACASSDPDAALRAIIGVT